MKKTFIIGLTVGLVIAGIVVVTVFYLLPQLKEGEKQPNLSPIPHGDIEIGPSVDLATKTIGSYGGSIKLESSGSVLEGLELNIPRGAYATSRKIKLSSAPVQSHTFGDEFKVASPLITVENGGRYSRVPMTMKIPAKIPDGHSAMAFYYDKESGTLDGIPTLAEDSKSITIATRHFSLILVVLEKRSALLSGDFDSGFRPGKDDWQFPNNGTYVSPPGICSGMSHAAIWYFLEQTRKRAPRLYGLYDNDGGQPTPEFWQDDALALKLASTVQRDNEGIRRFRFLWREKTWTDTKTYCHFANAIKKTGKPQIIWVNTSWSGHEGHAMIVYRADHGKLFVADPNYPGDSKRTINLVDGQFESYESKGTQHKSFFFFGTTSLVDWTKIGERWAELKDGTIGSDIFPSYTLTGIDEKTGRRFALVDGCRAQAGTIDIEVFTRKTMALMATGYTGTEEVKSIRCICNNRKEARGLRKVTARYQIKPGRNELGFYVWGMSGDERMGWIDFRRVSINTDTQPEMVDKTLTLNLGKGVTMKLVLIPAGTFMMGSRDSAVEVARKGKIGPNWRKNDYPQNEHPQHEVIISKTFYMGIHEVTQAQYEAVMGKNPSYFKGRTNPVERVSWNDATAFCNALSRKTVPSAGLMAGMTVRLPTEAQWEYACRAGTTTPFNTGETISSNQANCNDYYTYGYGRKGFWRKKTLPVGSFKPNAFGLYDMHGNVSELCRDWYDKDYYAKANKQDPENTTKSMSRVTRGSCWGSAPVCCRSAYRRGYWTPDSRRSSFGFRVVVDLSRDEAKEETRVRPEARPIYSLLRAVKENKPELLRSVWSREYHQIREESGWPSVLERYQRALGRDLGEYELKDLTFEFKGGQDSGKVIVVHKGRKGRGSLNVVKEDGVWKMDEN